MKIHRTLLNAFVFCFLGTVCLQGFPVSFYYENTPGTGFFDTTPTAPVGGNTGATLGEQRKIALEYAVRWWASRIVGNVTINVKVKSEYSATNGLLANAVPQAAVKNWTQGTAPPLPNVYYPSILAAQISGYHQPSLDPPYDVVIRLNTYWEDTLTPFYYGLDGQTGVLANDFVEVMLHEFVHGLGFVKGSLQADGTYAGGDPSLLNLLTTDSAGNSIAYMTVAQRLAVMTSNGAMIGGPILRANNGGERARWHSPDPYVEGGSFAHFDEATYSFDGSLNSLMTPDIDATPTHVAGPLTLDLLRDMGYVFADNLPPVIGIDFPVEGRPVKGTPTLRGTVTDTAPGGSATAVGMLKVRAALYSEAEGKWYRWVPGTFDAAVFNAANHVKDTGLDNIPIPTGTRKWSLKLPVGLAEGTYQLHVSGVDQLHQDTSYVSRTFNIDNTAPTAHITPYAASTPVFDLSELRVVSDDATSVTLTIRRDVSGTQYWNGTAWITSGTPVILPMTEDDGGGSFKPSFTLPGRGDWQPGSTIHFSATASDAASNVTTSSLTLSRTAIDTTTPTVTISSPPEGAVYAERAMAVPLGEALDLESDISSVGVYLMRLVPGADFKYWNGHAWSDTAAYLPANYQPADHRWWTPALGYRLPSDTELPDATYKVQAVAVNREVPQQGSTLVERIFRVAVDPPRVAVNSVTHNGWAKAGWTLAGTVTDTAGVTFSNSFNRVSLTINRDGQYWDGNSWESSQQTVYANILPDNTWTYPGTTPDAQMPTGDGSYSVSAHVRDNNGNVNAIIAGGLPGNNQVIFTVDATPPLLTLASPAPGTTVNSSPLPAGWIHGTSFDSSGPVTVTFRLKRLPSVVFTDYFWNGEIWKDSPASSTPLELDLNGTFPADNGPTSWKFTGHQPRPGWDFPHCLINGAYEVVAVAKDLAGNETTLTRPFTVDYNPQYIPPAFENMPMQPLQTPVFPTSALGGNNASSFNPLNPMLPVDDRAAFARKLVKSPTGPYYVASLLNPPQFSQSISAIVLQRLGSTPWRLEYTTYASILALEADPDGNLYALYVRKNLPQVVLVKYTSAGDVVWSRDLPATLPDVAFIGSPALKKMAWLPDGSLGLLFAAMVVIETDGDVRFIRRFGIVNSSNLSDPANFDSTPVDFAGDAAGNVFVASIETDRFTGSGAPQAPDERRIIRKLSPTGATLATHITITCDFPEVWDKLATDPAGNLYVAGRFIGGIRSPNDPARQEMLKFDNNLAFQWRAFGPARNPEAGDNVSHLDAGADGVMTIDNSGMAAFFTSAGALKWARPIIAGGGNSYLFTFAGGSAVGILHIESSFITQHLVKISRAGDTQFDMPFDVNYDQIIDIKADTSDIYLLRQSLGSSLPYLDTYYNIPDATIPVTLDPVLPRDQVLIAGDALEMKVINSGTLATGYQWRKYDNGTPVAISGATSEKFTIGSLVLGDAGLYDCVVTNPNNNATSRTATLSVLAPAAFDVALDTPGRTWTTGGDAPFVGFMAQNPAGPAHDNTDAIMNRPLGVNQTSYIETTVTGPGSVTFWWKSSNEQFTDDFTFSVDGDDLHSISGVQDWAPVTQSYGPGTHTLRWTYYKFSNSTATGDRVWLDDITFPTTMPLAEALDTTGLSWTTSAGGLAWTGVSSPSHDGVDSAASGTTGNNQQSFMETTVTGPGTLSFWWKVSSEDGFDALKLTVDGAPYGSASGEVDWMEIVRPISAGTHVIRWSYEKDGFLAGGQDRAWVDQVVFTGGGSAPDIAVESPLNHALIDNGGLGVDFGTALADGSTVRSFTIRNTGTAPLSSIVVSKSGGPSAALFTIGALSTTDPILPGGTATFDVTFAPTAEGSRGAALHITSNDPDESPFDIGIYGTGGVPITSWRQTHFGTTANTGNAADDADADGDGVPNLLEFATQGTPGTADEEPGEMAPMDNSGFLFFSYTRNKQAMAEVSYQVEWTDDLLLPWSSVGVVESITGDTGLLQFVTATVPAGSTGHRFIRLRVTRTP